MSRSQGIIIIDNIGATILDLETEFEQAKIMKYPLGDWLHNKISRQEYKEKMAIYRDKQSQYVAKRLFEIYGFEIAQKYKPDYVQDFIPCMGADGQCNLYCKKFGKC